MTEFESLYQLLQQVGRKLKEGSYTKAELRTILQFSRSITEATHRVLALARVEEPNSD